MAKKRLDFKALLLNHGEKFGAGVIGVLAVTGLATANWSTCSRLESELKEAANKTRETWNSPANVISEEKKALFDSTPDVELLANRMASPNEDIEQFAWVRHLNEPINRVREKLAPVVVLPPESPESSLVTFALVQKPDEEEATDAESMTEKSDEPEETSAAEKDLADLFGDNKKSGIGAAGAFPGDAAAGLLPGGAGAPAGYPGTQPGAEGYASSGPGMGMMVGGPGMPGMMEGLDGYGSGGYMGGYPGMEGSMGAATIERKVRSCAGVSVRAVFDLYKQTNMLAEALHIPAKDGQRYIDFVNLEIQRKAAISGPDPWAGEWEPLSLKDIAEILEEAAYNDRDIVNPSVVRSEITMPLPARAAGNWTPANASHKRLEEFQLSDEEKDLIDRHQAKLLEEANKLKKMLPPEQAKSEGFRKWGLASQDLGTALGGGMNVSGTMYSDYQSSIAVSSAEGAQNENAQLKKDPRFKTKEELEKFLNSTLVANRLLLVRFMDFTCDQGNSYRYRVRLEMRNPTFNMPVDELEQPELASQKTIFSGWSEPTAPVYVPGAYRYYTQKVDSRPRADEVAQLSMFYQHDTAGTPVMASLRVPVGVRIGGKQSLDVVDLGKSTLENQEIELKSLDFLASVTEAPRISVSDFPELRDIAKGMPGGRLVIPDRISVVDSTGAIVSRYVGDKVNGGNKEISESDDLAVTKFVLETYKHFRADEAAAAIGLPYGAEGGSTPESAMMGSGAMMMGMGADYMGSSGPGSSLGSNRSSRSSSRRGKGSRSGGGKSSAP